MEKNKQPTITYATRAKHGTTPDQCVNCLGSVLGECSNGLTPTRYKGGEIFRANIGDFNCPLIAGLQTPAVSPQISVKK